MASSATNNDDTQKLNPPKPKAFRVENPFGLAFKLLFLLTTLYWRFIFSIFYSIKQTFKNPKSLTGEVIVITGAAQDFGKSLAIELAKYGPKLILVDRDVAGLTEIAALINQDPENLKAFPYADDISSPDGVKGLATKIYQEFDHVDVLINNAGHMAGGDFAKFTNDEYSKMINLNFGSYVYMINEFLPGMLTRNKGHIVSISSMASISPITRGAVYSATKWAITGLMESLRDELRKVKNNEIKTTTICPYFMHINSDYLNQWNIRIPPLSVEVVAKNVVQAILKEELFYCIPSYKYYLLVLRKILPLNISDAFKDLLYMEFKNKIQSPTENLNTETKV